MNYARKEARHKVQANDETYIAVGAFIFSHDEFIRGAVVARFHRARPTFFGSCESAHSSASRVVEWKKSHARRFKE
jgi:hypothetical protein